MRNKAVKTRVKNVTKDVRLAVDEASKDEASKDEAAKNLNLAKSAIDNAAKKSVIHKNTAARKISRLSNLVNSLNN